MRAACLCFVLAMLPAGASAADEKGGKALVFRWEEVPGAAGYVIEIAEDKAFAQVVVRERTAVNVFRWQSLARRSYYWRVKAIERDGREGKFSEVRLIGAVVTPPALLEPASGARIAWGDDAPRIDLRWQRSDLVARYRVELARSPSFDQDVIVREVASAELEIELTEPGRWSWRVGGVDLNGDPVATGEERGFEVVIAPPEPTAPSSTVPWSADELEVRLQWKARRVAEYQVEVSRDRTFTRGVWRGKATATSTEYRPQLFGEHHWRVRGRSTASGGDTEWSRTARFTVTLASPKPISPDEGQVISFRGDAGSVELRWDPVPKAAGYLVEVVPEGGAGAQMSVRAAAPPASLALPGGAYTWSVRALGSDLDSAPSPPRRFQLEPLRVLDAPAIAAPADGAALVVAQGAPVLLAWSEVEGAARYEVELADGADFGRVVDRWAGGETRVARVVPAGRLHWRVRALDDAGVASAWSVGSFASATARPATTGDVVRPAARPRAPGTLSLAPEAGVFVHPGAVVAPTVGLELAWQFPGRIRIAFTARYFTATAEVAGEGELGAAGRIHAIPVALVGAYDLGWGYAGVGATLAVIHATVSAETQPELAQQSLVFGAVALAGAQRAWGPGRLFAEVTYVLSQRAGGVAEVDPSGVTGVIGYRIRLR